MAKADRCLGILYSGFPPTLFAIWPPPNEVLWSCGATGGHARIIAMSCNPGRSAASQPAVVRLGAPFELHPNPGYMSGCQDDRARQWAPPRSGNADWFLRLRLVSS